MYAELIRNRAFKDDAEIPVHWSVLDAGSQIRLDTATPLNEALNAW